MEVNKEAAALSCQNGNAAMRNGDCDRAVESPSMVTISVSSNFKLRHHPFWLASVTEVVPSIEWPQGVGFEQAIGKCEAQITES